MSKDKWYIGSKDGVDYTLTNDLSKMPDGAKPAPLAGFPTSQQRQVITRHGGHLDIIDSHPESEEKDQG